jgi:D-alanyl-D-alanine carboxypeptidase/D-alanyl-D-alanine-endopeptidase (penicillin-binding protein 4)
MRFIALFSLWISLLVTSPVEAQNSQTIEAFQQKLARHLSQPKFDPAVWGIKIVSLHSGKTLFETNAHELLKPASNAKSFTGALALDVLGADHRIKTSLLSKAAPNASGTLSGDLIVYGRGDPTFSARFQDNSYTNLFGRMVEAFRKAGIKEVKGDLVGDDTFFVGPPYGSSWTWDDLQYYYGAEVSALTFQDNVIDLFIKPTALGNPCEISIKPETAYLEIVNRTRTSTTNVRPSITVTRPLGERRAYVSGSIPVNHGTVVDAVTVPKPALWFMISLRDVLEKNGIRIRGEVRTRSWPEHSRLNPADFKELAFTESLPNSEIVAKMLKPSQNLYAQLLLLQVGALSKVRASETENAGLAELRSFARRAGIDPNEVLLDEGSGLSRAALVTAHSLVSLHQFMARHPLAAVYRNALPAPGEGTLRSRYKDLASANLRAKTGTIRYVNTLSGYIDSAAGEQFAFAILLNAYDNKSSVSSRDEIDFIVRALAALTEKTR